MNYGEIAGIYSRPITVMVIGAVLLVLGILSIIFGILMLTDLLDQYIDQIIAKFPELEPLLKFGPMIFVIGGLINTLTGVGFILAWKATWYVAIIMLVATVIASMAFIALSDITISDRILISTGVVIAISVIMMLSLFRLSVRSYFLD